MKRSIRSKAYFMDLPMSSVVCFAPKSPANIMTDTVNVSVQRLEAKTTQIGFGSTDSVLLAAVARD